MTFLPRILPALLTALVAVTACNDSEPVAARYAALTPNHDSLVLALESPERAALELGGSAVVDLELGAPEGDDLVGACDQAFDDGDRTVMPVLNGPLAVGDLAFDAPVLEARCDAETATNRLVLRESSDAECAAGECLEFADPEATELIDDPSLTFADAPMGPDGACLPAGHSTCVSCGGGLLRLRTVTSITYAPPEWICKYGYHYGPCSPICGE